MRSSFHFLRRLLWLAEYFLGIHTVERILASQHLITNDIHVCYAFMPLAIAI